MLVMLVIMVDISVRISCCFQLQVLFRVQYQAQRCLHAGVLSFFKRDSLPVVAVRGNVDEEASEEELPRTRLVVVKDWRILIIHILPKTDSPVRSSKSTCCIH